MITLTPDTWLISDTHWKHKNIIAFCNRPLDCDAQMVVNWHRLVQPTDEILHLGDLALGVGRSWGVYETLLATLTGRRFLLKGNHDRHRAAFYRSIGFEVLDPSALPFAPTVDSETRRTRVLRQTVLGRRLALSHVPLKDDASWDLNLHGHIHNLYYLPDPKWVNLSVEVRQYQPVRLGSLIRASS
jgi:calcineurin-like phosphoesterase family protein